MNGIDYAILAILLLSAIMGLARGLIAEVLSLIFLVLAFWVAWTFGPALAERLAGSISTPILRVALGYALCFVGVLLAGALIRFVLRKLIAGVGLSGTDRLFGMIFGLVRGAAVVVVLVLIVGVTPFANDPAWKQSRLLGGFEGGARWLADRLPTEVSRYAEPAKVLLPALPPPPSDHAPARPVEPEKKSSSPTS
ncbi:MAG: CvpA family protein [Dokdonella sp.]